MDAVVLVGGLGTRLQPLTVSRPKHVLPLVDRPLISYLLEQLARAGVTRVILSCGYMPDRIQDAFPDGGASMGLTLEYAVEERLLDTAGAIRFAAQGRVTETFLALNGDILSDIDLASLIAGHRQAGAQATIGLTAVDDPSRYGLVRTADDGQVLEFLEKPSSDQIDTDTINAGAYVLEPEVLEQIPAGQRVSIERDIFRGLIGRGLYARRLPGYWSDVGTPESYLAAHRDVLDGAIRTHLTDQLRRGYVIVGDAAEVSPDAQLVPPVYVGPRARIAAGARVGLGSCIGPDTSIGASVVEGSVVQAGASIGSRTSVVDSIVGPRAEVGDACRLSELCVVGPDVRVGADNVLRYGVRLFTGTTLPERAIRF